MPTVLYTSAVREACDGFSLSLTMQHMLLFGDDDGSQVHSAKGRIPNIDIVSRGDVVLCFCGLSNGRPVLAPAMEASAPARRIQAYLKMNAQRLGFSTVSKLYIDDDGVAKVNMTPSTPYEPEAGYRVAYLLKVTVTIAFRSQGETAGHCVFSEQMYLPSKTAFDRLVDKFVSIHLVRRYPLIFGSLRQKLQAERTHCSSISNSVLRISERSPNDLFRAETAKLLTRLDRKLSREAQNLSAAYCRHADIDAVGVHTRPSPSDGAVAKDVIPCALSRILRSHIRPARFKAVGNIAQCPHNLEPSDEFPFTRIDDRNVAMPSMSKSFQTITWDDLPAGLPDPPPDVDICPTIDHSAVPTEDCHSILGDESDTDDLAPPIWDKPLVSELCSDSDECWDLDDAESVLMPDDMYDSASAELPCSPVCSRDSSQSDTLDTPSESQHGAFPEELLVLDDSEGLLWSLNDTSLDSATLNIRGKHPRCYRQDLLDSGDDLPLPSAGTHSDTNRDVMDVFDTLSDPEEPPRPAIQQNEPATWLLRDEDDAAYTHHNATSSGTSPELVYFDEDGDLLMYDEDAAHFTL